VCFHEIIRAALAGLGITTHLCQVETKSGEVLCFLHHTPGDLLLGSHKVAGSAQRKQRGAILQHGGILLARSPFTPCLPGIAELSGIAVAAETLQSALIAELARSMGWTIEPGEWTVHEKRTMNDLLAKYCSEEWNRRR
jgi:lipoate-protein ligase A